MDKFYPHGMLARIFSAANQILINQFDLLIFPTYQFMRIAKTRLIVGIERNKLNFLDMLVTR